MDLDDPMGSLYPPVEVHSPFSGALSDKMAQDFVQGNLNLLSGRPYYTDHEAALQQEALFGMTLADEPGLNKIIEPALIPDALWVATMLPQDINISPAACLLGAYACVLSISGLDTRANQPDGIFTKTMFALHKRYANVNLIMARVINGPDMTWEHSIFRTALLLTGMLKTGQWFAYDGFQDGEKFFNAISHELLPMASKVLKLNLHPMYTALATAVMVSGGINNHNMTNINLPHNVLMKLNALLQQSPTY